MKNQPSTLSEKEVAALIEVTDLATLMGYLKKDAEIEGCIRLNTNSIIPLARVGSLFTRPSAESTVKLLWKAKALTMLDKEEDFDEPLQTEVKCIRLLPFYIFQIVADAGV